MLILPSAVESFGMVILEAWAAKKPVIALDVPIFREVVDDGVDGLLVAAGDSKALANAISKLLNNPTLAAAMGRAGYSKVRSKHSWATVSDRIQEALPSHY